MKLQNEEARKVSLCTTFPLKFPRCLVLRNCGDSRFMHGKRCQMDIQIYVSSKEYSQYSQKPQGHNELRIRSKLFSQQPMIAVLNC